MMAAGVCLQAGDILNIKSLSYLCFASSVKPFPTFCSIMSLTHETHACINSVNVCNAEVNVVVRAVGRVHLGLGGVQNTSPNQWSNHFKEKHIEAAPVTGFSPPSFIT